jgi:hypothetical protein
VKSVFQSCVHDQYRSTAQAYDKLLLQKLDARSVRENITPPRSWSNYILGSANDASVTSRVAYEHRHLIQLKALSLLIMRSRRSLAECPLMGQSETPTTVPPQNPYPRSGDHGHDFRSPSDAADCDRSAPRVSGSCSNSIVSVGDDVSPADTETVMTKEYHRIMISTVT